MKNKEEKSKKKFNLEKFEVAKLKNMRVIIGGNSDDPIDTNHKGGGGSTGQC
ncbi:hypothetical protein EYY60_20510 [Flavobacterium zhairuonense]|uniref:hypothetical protein n=1 Tax=Flavobacterium zhairuonense TaxID=2493631 RepID=UPI0013C2EAEC|nr:hypothetical protein [Flavobacterium zhairuonense]KAF2506899.1 hypothetical protein EYY60_20510 [Flavobacterium zhairuonense]